MSDAGEGLWREPRLDMTSSLSPKALSMLESTLFGSHSGISILSAVEQSQEDFYREVLVGALMGEEYTLEEVAGALVKLPDEAFAPIVQLRHHLRAICNLGAYVCDKLEESGLGGAAGHLDIEPAQILVNEALVQHFGVSSIDELEEVSEDLGVHLSSDESEYEDERANQGLSGELPPWASNASGRASWQPDDHGLGREEEASFQAPSESGSLSAPPHHVSNSSSGSNDMRSRSPHPPSDWMEALPDTGPDPWLGLDFAGELDETPSEEFDYIEDPAGAAQDAGADEHVAHQVNADPMTAPVANVSHGHSLEAAPDVALDVAPGNGASESFETPMAGRSSAAASEAQDPFMSALHEAIMAEVTDSLVESGEHHAAGAGGDAADPADAEVRSTTSHSSELLPPPVEERELGAAFVASSLSGTTASHSAFSSAGAAAASEQMTTGDVPTLAAHSPTPSASTAWEPPAVAAPAPPSVPSSSSRSSSWIELVEDPDGDDGAAGAAAPQSDAEIIRLDLTSSVSSQLNSYMMRGRSGSSAAKSHPTLSLDGIVAPTKPLAPQPTPEAHASLSAEGGQPSAPALTGTEAASNQSASNQSASNQSASPPAAPPSFLLTLLQQLGDLDEPDMDAWLEFMRGPVFHADHSEEPGTKGMRQLMSFIQTQLSEGKKLKERLATVEARQLKLQRLEDEQEQHNAYLERVDETLNHTERLMDQLFYAEPVVWSELSEELFPVRPALYHGLARIGETLETWRMGYDDLVQSKEQLNQDIEDFQELVKDKERLISHVERQLVESEDRLTELQRQLEKRNAETASLKVLSLYNHLRFLILSLKVRIQDSIAPKGILGRRSLPPQELMKLFVQDMDQIEKIHGRLQERLKPEELKTFDEDLGFCRKYAAAFRKRLGPAAPAATDPHANGKGAAKATSQSDSGSSKDASTNGASGHSASHAPASKASAHEGTHSPAKDSGGHGDGHGEKQGSSTDKHASQSVAPESDVDGHGSHEESSNGHEQNGQKKGDHGGSDTDHSHGTHSESAAEQSGAAAHAAE